MPIPPLAEISHELFKILGVGSGGGLLHAGCALKFVTLVRLNCVETEDSTGADETYLSMYIGDLHETVDSAALGALQQAVSTPAFGSLLVKLPTSASPLRWGWSRDGDPTLNDGQGRDIGLTMPLAVKTPVIVKCFDADGDFWGDDDDYLNEVRIAPNAPAGRHTATIKGDGAHYRLIYDVSEVKIAPPDVLPPVLTGVPGSGEAKLSWATVLGAQSFELLRDNASRAKVPGSTATYRDTGLTVGRVYNYTLRAVNAAGKAGPVSNQVAVTPLPVSVPTEPLGEVTDDLLDVLKDATNPLATQRETKTPRREGVKVTQRLDAGGVRSNPFLKSR